MFSPDFREFIALLNKHAVRYMIVGDYAVGIHGHPRYTGDLDIKESDLTKEDGVIQFGYPPLRIDLLSGIDGVHFNDCYPNMKIINIDGLGIDFIGYADLIKNKKASGRHQDLGDIDNLKE